MKNLLKSIFISIFPVLAIYAMIVSGIYLFKNGFSFLYLGQLIISTTIVFFFAGLFLIPQARTSKNLTIYSIIIVIGFIINIVLGSIFEDSYLFLSSINVVLFLSWIAYLKWYSEFESRSVGRKSDSLEIGNKLPTFKVEDISENIISSETFIGKPTIYLFYRGNWCPLCMAQIKEIAAQYKELEKRGVTMNFISPQPHSYSNKLAEKYNLGFNFLTDTDNKVSKQLGIFSENGIPAGFQVFGYDSDTVLPTVIITDTTGKIIFLDETDNYRVRPEPETFLRVLDGIK
ncbi:MAG: alkyl hydroperoxide reductase [Flavobacterium sp.]|nr:MAG: alkyl hydroperoxide reductase [Flavobacterium sp.]